MKIITIRTEIIISIARMKLVFNLNVFVSNFQKKKLISRDLMKEQF